MAGGQEQVTCRVRSPTDNHTTRGLPQAHHRELDLEAARECFDIRVAQATAMI